MMSNAQTNGKQTIMQEPTKLEMAQKWDKVFPKSNKVEHKKITFHNHFGIELAADMYVPKGAMGKLPAIAVSGPFGAVKEQSSGLYTQKLAEMGFLTIAFDPSFTGESGGQPRDMFSLDINTEDYQAAVDYLSNLSNVDANRIGILGICGLGGIALNAAANDPRIKATVVSTMYDMPRVGAWGYNDSGTAEQRYQNKEQIAQLRTKEYATGAQQRAATNTPFDKLTGDEPAFMQQYSEYYTTKRGFHERSVNSKNGWKLQAMTGWMNNNILAHPEDLRNAVLIVHGEKAHSRYMGEDTFKKLTGNNKQLYIVPGANHTDLYDGGNNNYIPFDKIRGVSGLFAIIKNSIRE
nr:alpha/beta hydrolase [Prevotella intermedia]